MYYCCRYKSAPLVRFPLNYQIVIQSRYQATAAFLIYSKYICNSRVQGSIPCFSPPEVLHPNKDVFQYVAYHLY